MYCYTNLSINFLVTQKITIKDTQADTHTQSYHRDTCTRSHTCSHTHKIKCAILDLALWTYGAVCIDLLVWLAMQCKIIIFYFLKRPCFIEWRSLPFSGLQAETPSPGEIKFTLEHIDINGPHEYVHAYAVMAGIWLLSFAAQPLFWVLFCFFLTYFFLKANHPTPRSLPDKTDAF